MKNTIIFLFGAIVFFTLGYLFSARAFLFNEYVETNSNVLSRSFIERSSAYIMLRQDDMEKATKTFESLIYSDLIAMEVIDFSDTSNRVIFCTQLNRLKKSIDNDNVFFTDQLDSLITKCE